MRTGNLFLLCLYLWLSKTSSAEIVPQPSSLSITNQSAAVKNFLNSLGSDVLGSKTPSAKDVSSQGQTVQTANDPLETLRALGSMPKEMQSAFLESFGETLKAQMGQECNIYGGKESCMTLPSDSEFARLCPDHDLKVDCAYYSEDMKEIQFNPVRDLKKALEAAKEQDDEEKCPECFDNQLKWFCAAIVPKCGSFQASIESAILPALSKVVEEQENGKSWPQALSAAMPTLVKANSLGLPCKEMCHSVLETCACGKDRTLGQLLQSYSEAQTGKALPAAFSMDLFSAVSNISFCDLYSSSSQQGFSGACQTLSSSCSDRAGWCEASNVAPLVATEIMAGQLVDSLFGLMSSWDEGNLGSIRQAGQVTDLDELYVRSYDGATQASSKSNTWQGVFLGSIATVAVFGGLAAGYWFYRYKRSRQDQEAASQYIAMAEGESLLNHRSEPL